MESQRNVLIVDDDELGRDVLSFFLRKKFNVYTVGKVSSFYGIIATVDFHLFLMDISLSDSKDGIQLTAELRQNEKYKNTPIIMISAYGTTKIRSDAFNVGANKFITKPVTREILEREVFTILNGG
jgi:DNA-binding response OmpR family regulator